MIKIGKIRKRTTCDPKHYSNNQKNQSRMDLHKYVKRKCKCKKSSHYITTTNKGLPGLLSVMGSSKIH